MILIATSIVYKQYTGLFENEIQIKINAVVDANIFKFTET